MPENPIHIRKRGAHTIVQNLISMRFLGNHRRMSVNGSCGPVAPVDGIRHHATDVRLLHIDHMNIVSELNCNFYGGV